MKKLVAVILTVVLAAVGGGLFHALDVPAGWLTGAMIAVAAGAMARVPLHMPAPAANGALVLLGISMGAGVTPGFQAQNREALVGFRGDGERAQATSASIKEPSKAFPRLRTL